MSRSPEVEMIDVQRDERGGDGMGRLGARVRQGVVAVVVAVTLTACAGLGEAGSAASVGDVQVTTDFLSEQVDAVQEQRGETPGAPDNALVLGILQRLIITELVGQAATAQNITITQGDIDAAQAELEAQLGGAEALTAAFLDSDVPAGSISQQVQLSLQVQALGMFLAPDADPESQQLAVVQYVTGWGVQEGVEVSPRFGTWDAGRLTIGPTPSDLSFRPGTPDPLAELLPAP